MVFIRIKKIKGQPYAYSVSNKWTAKGSRQKVGKYLGKVIQLENQEIRKSSRESKDYSADTAPKTAAIPSVVGVSGVKEVKRVKRVKGIKELYENQLVEMGFIKIGVAGVVNDNGISDGVWKKDKILINLTEKTVRQGSKKVVIATNEGFICDNTIKDMLEYKPGEGKTEEALGMELAKRLLEAGLKADDEEFVAIFESLFPNKQFFPGSSNEQERG